MDTMGPTLYPASMLCYASDPAYLFIERSCGSSREKKCRSFDDYNSTFRFQFYFFSSLSIGQYQLDIFGWVVRKKNHRKNNTSNQCLSILISLNHRLPQTATHSWGESRLEWIDFFVFGSWEIECDRIFPRRPFCFFISLCPSLTTKRYHI